VTDILLADAPAVSQTKTSVGTDPLGSAERAQEMYEKGPITAVAGFFTVAFFVALFLLLRAKDKHRTSEALLQATHSKETSLLMEKHAERMAALYTEERTRAIKHEVTMSNYLDMMDDVRFIAFEMRRVKMAREKKQRTTAELEAVKGEPPDAEE
jgi:hypothetical protein